MSKPTYFDGLKPTHWQPETRDNGVVVLWFDRADASTNAISQAVLHELSQLVERLNIEQPKGVVFASKKEAGFSPGADIPEFKALFANNRIDQSIKLGQQVYQRIAELNMPTVAAIHGYCMGGATELTLACRFRLVSDDDSTRISLPEVKLGILPGWGGLSRLPKLIGAPAALDMMLTGRTLSAKSASKVGLVHGIHSADSLVDEAVNFCLTAPQRSTQKDLKNKLSNAWPARQFIAKQARQTVSRKARKEHYPAPYAIINTWLKSGGKPIHQRLAAERRAFVKLAQSPTATNLLRVYQLQEALKESGNKDHGIERVHVIGAGVMGGDIAAWCAYKGCEVSLQDREMKYITPAIERAHKLYEKKCKRSDTLSATKTRLKADVEGTHVPEADLIIEAIFEDMDAKKALYANADANKKKGALIVSNTSSLAMNALAEGVTNPEHFAGLHFFNPVAMMPLVEIVRHDGMDADTETRLAGFCRTIGKLPVPVKGTPGFLVNRVLMPYLMEAMYCVKDGIPMAVIDKAAKKFGMPMGPIELADTVGLDVCMAVAGILAEPLNLAMPDGLSELVDAGSKGKKTGRGFYTWTEGKAVKPAIPEGYKAPEDLTDRLIMPMINESVACLDNGVVDSRNALDAGVIFGTGFAPFTGGPINWAYHQGVSSMKERLNKLAETHGDRFQPKDGWHLVGDPEGHINHQANASTKTTASSVEE